MKEFVISEAKTETAVLVGLITPQQSEAKANEYLNELEFKSTDEYAPNNTPDNGITVVLKNGDKLGMSIYGAEIAFLYPIEKYPDNCKLYGYNPKEFVNLCKNLNLSEMKSNDK